jgi:hypothetical protein
MLKIAKLTYFLPKVLLLKKCLEMSCQYYKTETFSHKNFNRHAFNNA